MLFVVLVLTAVLSSVLPGVNAHSVHVIIDPFALVLTTIEPGVGAKALNLVLLPLSIVPRSVVPAVNTFTVLLSRKVFSFVH
jgi:hypothetical protein